MNFLTQKNTSAILAEIYLSLISSEYLQAKDWPVHCLKTSDGYKQYFTFRGSTLRFLEVSKEKLAPSWDEINGLWFPQALPFEIWQESLATFESNKALFTNIQNKLIPIIFKYFSESEIENIICDYFCKRSILWKPIRSGRENTPSLECVYDENFTSGWRTYYFDDERILRVTNNINMLRSKSIYKPDFCTLTAPVLIKKWELSTHFFRAGMSLKDCVHIFLDISERDSREIMPPKFSDFDRLVQMVEKPIYEREPENHNMHTFDRIRVTVHLSKYIFTSRDELKNAVKAYRKHIDKLVLSSIKQDSKFTKYGIPYNFLTLSSLVLKKDATLEYIFDLREVSL